MGRRNHIKIYQTTGKGIEIKGKDSTEELNDLLKTYSEWMTKLKAMSDKNVSHLAEMCIQGYTMGMVKAIQKSHLYCDASKEAKHFGEKLISLHEKSINDLKKYL